MAVIHNPFARQFVEDLRPLFEAGAMLGERLMPELVRLLDGPPVSYGKAAIVDVAGEMEHGGACVHPMLGKPMRAAVEKRSSDQMSRWRLRARFSTCRSGTRTMLGHSHISTLLRSQSPMPLDPTRSWS